MAYDGNLYETSVQFYNRMVKNGWLPPKRAAKLRAALKEIAEYGDSAIDAETARKALED